MPELGRLSGSQQAPGEPACPLAGHRRPCRSRLGPGASVSRRSPGRASPLYPPAVQEAELGAFPPPSPLNSQEAGFSRAHPHSAHPLRSLSSSPATLQTLRLSSRAANSVRLGRICSRSRGTRVGGGSTRAAHTRLGTDAGLPLLAPRGTCQLPYPQIRCAWRVGDLVGFLRVRSTF